MKCLESHKTFSTTGSGVKCTNQNTYLKKESEGE